MLGSDFQITKFNVSLEAITAIIKNARPEQYSYYALDVVDRLSISSHQSRILDRWWTKAVKWASKN